MMLSGLSESYWAEGHLLHDFIFNPNLPCNWVYCYNQTYTYL